MFVFGASWCQCWVLISTQVGAPLKTESRSQSSHPTPRVRSLGFIASPYQTLAIVLSYKLSLVQCPMEVAGAGGWVGKMFVVQHENVRLIISRTHVEI